jgi:nucleotidyltransferase substrate binding protein (TIGR01987 family)
MSKEGKRWEQRFRNFKKALIKLEEGVSKINNVYIIDEKGNVDKDRFLDDIIKEGIIHRFEYTHELAWNVMKDFFDDSGNNDIFGSKDATREAFSAGLIVNGDIWMDMIKSRNKTSHTYNEETADDIFIKIINQYNNEFINFKLKMQNFQTNKD